MSLFYELVGRAFVASLVRRYAPHIRAAGALAVAASVLGLGVYLATREGDDAAS